MAELSQAKMFRKKLKNAETRDFGRKLLISRAETVWALVSGCKLGFILFCCFVVRIVFLAQRQVKKKPKQLY